MGYYPAIPSYLLAPAILRKAPQATHSIAGAYCLNLIPPHSEVLPMIQFSLLHLKLIVLL